MGRYTATISHHSIASARVVDVGDGLTTAKRKATREFGDGFIDHVIVIRDAQAPKWDSIVAVRRIGNRRWA